MRTLLLVCCLVFAGLWLVPATVGASDAADRADTLENSLQAVEWYTNESVRKALQAESTGDTGNARLFGDKAIESDQKAQGLRQQTADAWVAAGKTERAHAVWHRAAEMARERADMLGKRIPTQMQQWQQAVASGDAASVREHEIQYLQAVFYTARHWEVVAQFSAAAGEPEQQRAALKQLQLLLPSLQRDNRLAAYADDARFNDAVVQLEKWQQMVAVLR
jgi:hypothetical protein